MTEEELKNKYSTFITKISEILGLGKPIDVLKLCATTDLFFQPLKKRIEELEKEKCELLGIIQGKDKVIKDLEWQSLKVLKDNDNYQTDNDKLEEENAELKEQLEKMKRCNMCKYSTRLGYCKIREHGGVCENRDKWEIKEE